MKNKIIQAAHEQTPSGVWQQLQSSVGELYHHIISNKFNRAMLAADITIADTAIGFPIAAKALYEIKVHNPLVNSTYLDPTIMLSSMILSAAISFYIYEKALRKLYELKRSNHYGIC